jgi:hypothetical protein
MAGCHAARAWQLLMTKYEQESFNDLPYLMRELHESQAQVQTQSAPVPEPTLSHNEGEAAKLYFLGTVEVKEDPSLKYTNVKLKHGNNGFVEDPTTAYEWYLKDMYPDKLRPMHDPKYFIDDNAFCVYYFPSSD